MYTDIITQCRKYTSFPNAGLRDVLDASCLPPPLPVQGRTNMIRMIRKLKSKVCRNFQFSYGKANLPYYMVAKEIPWRFRRYSSLPPVRWPGKMYAGMFFRKVEKFSLHNFPGLLEWGREAYQQKLSSKNLYWNAFPPIYIYGLPIWEIHYYTLSLGRIYVICLQALMPQSVLQSCELYGPRAHGLLEQFLARNDIHDRIWVHSNIVWLFLILKI